MAILKLKIDSILGGISPTWHYGAKSQFLDSIAIDPEQPYSTSLIKPAGQISPVRYQDFSSTGLSGAPMWIITNPKNTNVYIYASDGEFISYNSTFGAETVIGTPTSGVGNGAVYYNDYIYLTTPTDVSRYGPLSGTPALTNTVWTGATLGSQTALVNTTYPAIRNVTYPNHAMHVHVDNKLYLCDYVSGQGRISFIRTDNTGTNDASTRNALNLPFGYMPVDIESYGNDLAIIAIPEGSWTSGAIFKPGEAALFFWDTVSSSFYKQISLREPLATAILNVNGELLIWSGQIDSHVRLSRYIGGSSVEPLIFIREGSSPAAGAVDSIGAMVAWGAYGTYPATFAGVYTYGYRDGTLPRNAFNKISRITNTAGTLPIVSSIKFFQTASSAGYPVMGWRVDTTADYGLDRYGGTSAFNSIWNGPVFNLGQEFTVRNVRLTFPAAIDANTTITPTIYVDDEAASTALTTVNSTNYANSERIVDVGTAANGKNNFYLRLAFTGTTLLPANLPITITVHTLND